MEMPKTPARRRGSRRPTKSKLQNGYFGDRLYLKMRSASYTLTALWDALLPMLLSGELRPPSQGFGTAGVSAAKLTEAHA